MIWVLLSVTLMAATMAWMVHVVNDHRRRAVVLHVARAAMIPAGIFLSAGLGVYGLADLQNGLPL